MPRKTTSARKSKMVTPDPVNLSLTIPPVQVQRSVPKLEGAVEDAKAGRPFQGTVIEIAKQYHRENDSVLGADVTKDQLHAARDAALECIWSLDPVRVNILTEIQIWKDSQGKDSARGLHKVEAVVAEDRAKLRSLAEHYNARLTPEIIEAIEVANTEGIDSALDAWSGQHTTWHAGVLGHANPSTTRLYDRRRRRVTRNIVERISV